MGYERPDVTGSLCRRFGPGRLPYAGRRDEGAGIAMGATGLLATAVWYLGGLSSFTTGIVGTDRFDLSFATAGGVLVALLSVAAASHSTTDQGRFTPGLRSVAHD